MLGIYIPNNVIIINHRGEKMRVEEEFTVRYGKSIYIVDPDLKKQVKELVKTDFESLEDGVKKAIEELMGKAEELGYKPEELEALAEYDVSLYSDSYFVTVTVKVYPKDAQKRNRDDATLSKYVCINAEGLYISQYYKPEREELGRKMMLKIHCYERLARLLEENEELKKQVKTLNAQVNELTEKLKKLEARKRA
jgi:hypothetical protein